MFLRPRRRHAVSKWKGQADFFLKNCLKKMLNLCYHQHL